MGLEAQPLDYWSIGRAKTGFRVLRLTINFRMLTDFVLLSIARPVVRKTLEIHFSGYEITLLFIYNNLNGVRTATFCSCNLCNRNSFNMTLRLCAFFFRNRFVEVQGMKSKAKLLIT